VNHRAELTTRQSEGAPIAVSALTGEGIDALLQAIEARLARGRSLIDLELESADGQGLHWLYEHTEVMMRQADEDGGVHVTVRVPADAVERVKRRFAAATR
jgi:GTP-binding protein HflX